MQVYAVQKSPIYLINGELYGRVSLLEPTEEHLKEDYRRVRANESRELALSLGLSETDIRALRGETP
jgi:hypothetical protein